MNIKKTFIAVISFTALFLFSCETEEKAISPTQELKETQWIISSIATNEEYSAASDLEKEAIDMINASIAALEGLSLNDKNRNLNYVATFSLDNDGVRSNFDLLAIGLVDNSMSGRTMGGSSACGMASGIACAKMLIKAVNDNGGSLSGISITKNGSCYDIKW